MDPELRDAFKKLFHDISGVADDARTAVSLGRENKAEIFKISEKVDYMEEDIKNLKKEVFGSNPPNNPASNPILPNTPLAKKISSNELEVDSLKAQIIILDTKITKVENINEQQNKKLDDLASKLIAIHSAVTGFFSNKKVQFIGKVVFTLAVGVYAWIQGKQLL